MVWEGTRLGKLQVKLLWILLAMCTIQTTATMLLSLYYMQLDAQMHQFINERQSTCYEPEWARRVARPYCPVTWHSWPVWEIRRQRSGAEASPDKARKLTVREPSTLGP